MMTKYFCFLFTALFSLSSFSVEGSCFKTFSRIAFKNFNRKPLSFFEKDIHPAQFQVSFMSIRHKSKNIKKMNTEELQAYLNKKVIPFIIGPDGKKWIIDRHHTSLSLIAARDELASRGIALDEIFVKFRFLADKSRLEWHDFFQWMEQKNYIYPFKNGERLPFSSIPKTLGALTDDPYRGYAWFLRKVGFYEKEDTPFMEFLWADFLRKNITLGGSLDERTAKTLFNFLIDNYVSLKKLPGFIPLNLNKTNKKELIKDFLDKSQEFFE